MEAEPQRRRPLSGPGAGRVHAKRPVGTGRRRAHTPHPFSVETTEGSGGADGPGGGPVGHPSTGRDARERDSLRAEARAALAQAPDGPGLARGGDGQAGAVWASGRMAAGVLPCRSRDVPRAHGEVRRRRAKCDARRATHEERRVGPALCEKSFLLCTLRA